MHSFERQLHRNMVILKITTHLCIGIEQWFWLRLWHLEDYSVIQIPCSCFKRLRWSVCRFGECPSIIMHEGLTIVGHAQLSRVCHEYLSNWSLNSIIKRNLRVDNTLGLRYFLEIHASSRTFANIPQNGPEYSHRKLAIARFLVAAVRKNIGCLLSWLVSLSSSVPELTRHGLERSLHVNP